MRLHRQSAFWNQAIIDRPVVCIEVKKPSKNNNTLVSNHNNYAERWLDTNYQVESALAAVADTQYFGDALPIASPNLGPDFFSSCYGGELRFMEDTSFIEPFLADWADVPTLFFNKKNRYFMKLEELYTAFLDAGNSIFYTGMPDIHPGGDCLVGFRGPLALNYDVVDHAAELKQALAFVTRDFLSTFDHYYEKLQNKNQPITGWPRVVSRYKWHIPCNDFSCMISRTMFEELFLDELINEMKVMEKNMYHLDGPGALQHLDLLLTVKELDAVQWVYGAGNGRASDQLPIYQKIQNAGKGIQLPEVYADEVEFLIENLKPEGVWMQVIVDDPETAQSVMKRVATWK